MHLGEVQLTRHHFDGKLYWTGVMPAFVFATREMHAAALPFLDDLAEPITVVRNPGPDDPRPVHLLSESQLAHLRPRFAAAGITIELLAHPSHHPPASTQLATTESAR